MGFFAYICGNVTCVRCGADQRGCVQTKLMQVSAENASKEYSVGDRVVVDGLADYCPLLPPTPNDPLRLVVGEWTCAVCHLNYQWAVVTLDAAGAVAGGPFSTTIWSFETFVPCEAGALGGIHYLSEDLVNLAGRSDGDSFQRLPVSKRIAAVVEGYQRWLEEVALK